MPKTRSTKSQRPSSHALDPIEKKDILISIKSQHMNNIVARSKNHEFRNYPISRTVERMWLYVSSPDQTLRYIAIISQGKVPGEISDGDSGLGNSDFNNKLTVTIGAASHAYEVIHLYKLAQPLHISLLRERYSVSPPQRYTYTPKQLLDDVKLEDQEMLF
ncbi:hypothetical protein DFH08DRAFT_366784 [Mycena albidolilacea]|uniref:Uncharacterized protein n=1 Tax=Mycena albidolilacea TaxID=1033008 RepID=A0AAD7AKP8_9AGAR|nr:hypothetical protein DFH08DRAFT_366784 [Mycena albidolilacea]